MTAVLAFEPSINDSVPTPSATFIGSFIQLRFSPRAWAATKPPSNISAALAAVESWRLAVSPISAVPNA